MKTESIYVTYDKSSGELLYCKACRKSISRYDYFFKFAIQESAFGPYCRLGDCRQRNEVERNMSDAILDVFNVVSDKMVEVAVREVLEYDRQHLGSGAKS